jgi:hypothetical protein
MQRPLFLSRPEIMEREVFLFLRKAGYGLNHRTFGGQPVGSRRIAVKSLFNLLGWKLGHARGCGRIHSTADSKKKVRKRRAIPSAETMKCFP